MSYQVLARKYRPKTFDEVVGQEHVTRTLKNALRQGRLAHGFLFTGPRGVGKTSSARILARAVNCPNIDLKGNAEPCNVCETCQALFEDRELDVIEMDAATYNGVDDVRRINDSCRLAPVAGNKKIYIIDEVHMFSKPAFNAFLKTLEEPPSHVLFILATTDVHKVPATIRSRVQRFDFRPLGPNDIAPHLKHICESEQWTFDDEALWMIGRAGLGSLRDAEGLLDQVVSFTGGRVTAEETREVLGILPQDLMIETTEIISAQVIERVPDFLSTLATRGIDYTEFLRALQSFWSELVFVKKNLTPAGKSPDELVRMKAVSALFSTEDYFRLIRLAEKLEDDLKFSLNQRARFEIAFLRWSQLERLTELKALMAGQETAVPAKDSGQTRVSVAADTSARSAALRPDDSADKSARSAAVRPDDSADKSAPSAALRPEDSGQTKVSASAELTLDAVRLQWPAIIKALSKINLTAANSAESGWEICALDGLKLSVRPTKPIDMYLDQLKKYLPDLTQAVRQVIGAELVLIVKAAEVPPPAPVQNATKESEPTAVASGDMLEQFLHRFGGEEIDPARTKEPK